MTDAYGDFTVVIDADIEEDDLDILLALRGETFVHTIDIAKHQFSSEGKVYQDIQLEQDPSIRCFHGLWLFCCLLRYRFCIRSARTGRRLATPRGRMEFMGYRPARELECPECHEMVVQHELVKHLIVEHDFEPMDAGETTGKVMRRLWSERRVISELLEFNSNMVETSIGSSPQFQSSGIEDFNPAQHHRAVAFLFW